MKIKINTKEEIWTTLFLAVPAFIFSKIGDEFVDDSLSRIVLAGLLGGLGGVLGFGLFQLVKTKTTFVRTIAIILLSGLSVTTLIVATNLSKPTLETCDVCGYIAISSGKNECGYCGTLTWENQKKIKGYVDKLDWLKEEQLFWFSLDSLIFPIDFYEPTFHEGFYKDKNWEPIINQQDLIEYLNEEEE